jgi:hypothetical protein
VWETGTTGLFCEHSDVFSETWPTSGMTLAGMAFALPTWAQRTDGSASSSPRCLPTPTTMDGIPRTRRSGAEPPSTGRHRHPVASVGGSSLTLLPTPKASNNENRSSGWANGPNLGEALALLPTPVADNSRGLPSASTAYASLANVAASLLPTPRATDGTKGGGNSRASRSPARQVTGNARPQAARLLPTPSVADGMGGHLTRSGDRSNELLLPGVAKAHQQAWGQYAAAIARAEQAIGRPAPPPTEIGPKGAPRLSPRFVEFLMMLPEGWVTDVTGLTRNDQLKMLGNGVVPAQCAAALRAFLWDAYGIGAAA